MSKNDESKQIHCVEFGLYVPENYKKSLFKLFKKVSEYKNEFIRYVWNEINEYGKQDTQFAESVKIIQEQNKVYGKAVNKSDLDSTVKKSYEYVEKVILKSKSPSCGVKEIYDGTFTNNLIIGNGVTADLLLQNGIEVITEKDI